MNLFQMNTLILILLMTITGIVLGVNQNPGHLKAFGSVGSLLDVQELQREFPSVSQLFTYYIPKLEPILSRQVLNEDEHFSVWKTDKELLDQVYGLSDTNIQVESFKSRRPERVQMKFGDFLQRFGREPLFFAEKVPDILQKYLVVPKPLQCESVLDTFQSAIMVINGINSSPLLFHEEYDHFHCILRGSKRLVLVNTSKYPDVRKIVVPERRDQRLPQVNPERVDLDQFPALAGIDYHRANLTSGDCLFIPRGWIFQDRSIENTIAVIYNLKHQQALNVDANELKMCPEYDRTFTIDQIDWSIQNEPMSFKDLMIDLVRSKTEGFDQWQVEFSKHLKYNIAADPEASAIFEEFYALIDIDADGLVTSSEVEQINGEHQRHISETLYEMSKVMNTNRKKSASKPVNNEEQTDEYLQNYKTDL